MVSPPTLAATASLGAVGGCSQAAKAADNAVAAMTSVVFERIVDGLDVPVIPVHLDRASHFASRLPNPALPIIRLPPGKQRRTGFPIQRAFRLLHGTYGQRQMDTQMMRIKLPFGGVTADQMDALAVHPVDVDALLNRQRANFAAAWERFSARYPGKVQTMRRRIDEELEQPF